MNAPSALAILNIGLLELFLIVIAAIMLFGGDLPDVARKAGRLVGRLRSTVDDLRRYVDTPAELRDVPARIKRDLEDAARDGESLVAPTRREDEAPKPGSAHDAEPPHDPGLPPAGDAAPEAAGGPRRDGTEADARDSASDSASDSAGDSADEGDGGTDDDVGEPRATP